MPDGGRRRRWGEERPPLFGREVLFSCAKLFIRVRGDVANVLLLFSRECQVNFIADGEAAVKKWFAPSGAHCGGYPYHKKVLQDGCVVSQALLLFITSQTSPLPGMLFRMLEDNLLIS